MARHERLPISEQRPFTLSWRPVLDAMWVGLAGQREEASQVVTEALRAYYHSLYNHSDGPDGPNDADENAAAASIYAAECFLDGGVAEACWAVAAGMVASTCAW